MRIRRIGLFSAGKMLGAVSALVALLTSAIWALFAVALMGVSASQAMQDISSTLPPALPMAAGAVGVFVIIPIGAAILGFLEGALIALCYNVIASFVGGIVIDIDD
ncbi:MAG: hypothetical protein ACI841_000952 [Planctomycetota bacterium]|jgi:hypothetical protein